MDTTHIDVKRTSSGNKCPRPARLIFVLLFCVIAMATSTLTGELDGAGSANSSKITSSTESQSPKSTQQISQGTSPAPSTTSVERQQQQQQQQQQRQPQPTLRTPSEQEIEQAKRLIQEVATTMRDNPTRLAVNKPATSVIAPHQLQAGLGEFAPNSAESLASDSTTQFGLNFLRNNLDASDLVSKSAKNVVISPFSLQNLLSMLMLGSSGQTELELAQVLGYQASGLIHIKEDQQNGTTMATVDQNERMRPHEALHNVLESIMRATRFSPSALSVGGQDADDLLNANLQDLPKGPPSGANVTAKDPAGMVSALLQTNEHNGTQPLGGQVNFTLANLMLTNRDLIQLDANYELDLKHFYRVQIENFSKSVDSSSSAGAPNTPESGKKLHERVNDWIKEMTHNQIEQLVQESDLDERQQLAVVLLNAAHFKGRWLHTFAQRATQVQPFYGPAGQENEVPFMRQKGEFGFVEFGVPDAASNSAKISAEDAETLLTEDNEAAGKQDTGARPAAQVGASKRPELQQRLNCSALALPFSLNEGHELSMVLLLPNRRDGLAELMASLDFGTLNEVYKQLDEQQQQVQVEIPKFSFESTHDAKETLERMGLKRLFDENQAQLGRMVSNGANNHKASKVIHKAKIMVDESGAEAAAASLVSIVSRNFVRPTPVFQANRPFLFIIRHSRSNMPLFMGQVNSL